MASSASTNPDTLITVKVNIDNNNKKFKLPLRDLGANTLTDKLRSLLAIPSSAEAVFERYSDSAAAFVTLDSNNASVYKQLYRAAKAKLKLRLRVTVTNKEPTMPRPATVEDEIPSPSENQPDSSRFPSPPASPAIASAAEETAKEPTSLPSVAEIQRGFEDLLLNRTICTFPRRPTQPTSNNDITVARGAAARDKWFAELASVCNDRQTVFRDNTGPPAPVLAQTSSYCVYCNECNRPIPDEHYHCSTCDEGDYDLCKACIDSGVLCGGDGHWMIKRFVKNGKVIASTTTLAPRLSQNGSKTTLVEGEQTKNQEETPTRTCNSCIQEFPEENFVTCTSCDDFDLCVPCHVSLHHGHNPKHAFAPAVEDMNLDPLAKALLQPGRNTSHHAICDGCDKYIFGVRHKCLDCPDWDYCSTCIVNSSFIHPRHRFVPIYEPISDAIVSQFGRTRHYGIYCDGPLCDHKSTYIIGDRYKCAVCHDTDFCASCEASPSNLHNKTHPLIKFKTMVRSVNVTTTGDHDNGQPMPVMGDRRGGRTFSKATETTSTTSTNAATQVQTVADVRPSEPTEIKDTKTEKAGTEVITPKEDDLVAHFVRDTVPDGSILPPNCVFEQTWILRNGGSKPWPAGCTVKFVGGDNMCAVDPEHPASVHELVSATESTTCYTEVAPGQEFGFTVLMRTPSRAGKVISYWRLTGPTGNKFGHRLWCDVTVDIPASVVKEESKEETKEDIKGEPKEELQGESQVEGVGAEKSQMIFPKLEKESPATSIHQDTIPVNEQHDVGGSEDFVEKDDFDDENSEDGFLTDEEYDILDASDEEYLAEQEKAAKK